MGSMLVHDEQFIIFLKHPVGVKELSDDVEFLFGGLGVDVVFKESELLRFESLG